jgi:hypothetical protein
MKDRDLVSVFYMWISAQIQSPLSSILVTLLDFKEKKICRAGKKKISETLRFLLGSIQCRQTWRRTHKLFKKEAEPSVLCPVKLLFRCQCCRMTVWKWKNLRILFPCVVQATKKSWETRVIG